ncbi:hypothetical protein TNIN_103491 [Trichonephila inaurata madagascariensis]|uniref:Uncharacterized protein n=1 Tax=Trichonephila inaurata madagascariensis TaxID=2747483 RepID=A0A8X7CLY5_9ARAC|nr:hypothetical protein TNIN_103491 [Trichonephila inaurata madagascariensis]
MGESERKRIKVETKTKAKSRPCTYCEDMNKGQPKVHGVQAKRRLGIMQKMGFKSVWVVPARKIADRVHTLCDLVTLSPGKITGKDFTNQGQWTSGKKCVCGSCTPEAIIVPSTAEEGNNTITEVPSVDAPPKHTEIDFTTKRLKVEIIALGTRSGKRKKTSHPFKSENEKGNTCLWSENLNDPPASSSTTDKSFLFPSKTADADKSTGFTTQKKFYAPMPILFGILSVFWIHCLKSLLCEHADFL